MIAQELFEKYPKAAKIIVEHYTKIFIDSLNNDDITDDFKEMAKTEMLSSEYIQEFVGANPRGTFDIFDDNGIYITTPVSPADGYFKWEIETNKLNALTEEHEMYTSDWVNTRKEAEAAAVEKAFEILNQKL